LEPGQRRERRLCVTVDRYALQHCPTEQLLLSTSRVPRLAYLENHHTRRAIRGRTPAGEMRSLRLARQARERCMRENVLCSFHLQLVRSASARRPPTSCRSEPDRRRQCFDPLLSMFERHRCYTPGERIKFSSSVRLQFRPTRPVAHRCLALPRFVVSMPQEASRGRHGTA
jgi:hypothetical protein